MMPTHVESHETLRDIDRNPTRKTDFSKLRREFKNNKDAQSDLVAYENDDDTHNYLVLTGFVPEALVNTPPPRQGGPSWRKSDTFFTNYLERQSDDLVLSATKDSLIIRNDKSHDTRLYGPLYDPDCKDKSTAAGMSYLHLLVIPREKVYNAVSLDDAGCIREMIQHFEQFWLSEYACDRAIKLVDEATEERIRALETSLNDNKRSCPKGATLSGLQSLTKDVRDSAADFATRLRNMTEAIHRNPQSLRDCFFYGFHAHPHASIGHLHMHVLPVDEYFRKFSTRAHDWKTIPAQAVVEVIEQETQTPWVGCHNRT